MIIKDEQDVTSSVLSEIERSHDARFKEIMSSAVRHLHAWVREVRLTESEFQKAGAIVAKLGQLSNKSHNEVVLASKEGPTRETFERGPHRERFGHRKARRAYGSSSRTKSYTSHHSR
jgi:hypothetical protein